MPYCAGCGAPLLPTDQFCPHCGRSTARTAYGPGSASPPGPSPAQQIEGGLHPGFENPPTARGVHGLGRNTVVYLTREGLEGTEIRSTSSLWLAPLVPIPLLMATYYFIQAGALAVYITIWIAASALLYDELRWRGLMALGENRQVPKGSRKSWLVPWQSVRMADWNGRTLWFTSASPRRKLSVTFDRDDAPLVERTLDSYSIHYSRKPPKLPRSLTRFSTLVLLLFIIGQTIMILAATTPFFPGEEQLYTTMYNNTQNQIATTTFLGEFQVIYLNNIQVALGGALPFLGTLTYSLASYNTGRVIQAIAIADQTPPAAVLITLYILPHTWVEESAYPIATIAGILAFTKWRSVPPGEFSRKLNWGSTKLVMALGGAVALLAVAGLVETLTNYVGFDILAFWLVFAVLLYTVVRSRRRRLLAPTVGSP